MIDRCTKGYIDDFFFVLSQETENTLRMMQHKLREEERRLMRSGGDTRSVTHTCMTHSINHNRHHALDDTHTN